MHKAFVNKSVILALVFLISLLFLKMIQGFLMPLFMAGLFSAILKPAHVALSQKLGQRENLASLLLLIAIVLLVLVPFGLLISVVVGQALVISQSVTPWVHEFINEPSALNDYLYKIPYYEQLLPYRTFLVEKAGMLVSSVSTFLVDSLSSVTKMTVNAVFGSIIMLYVMFYFLSMGEKLIHRILYLLPLQNNDEQLLLHRFTSVTKATLKGSVIIGILQGTICGTAFALVGIEGAVFWGSIMALTSIIPVFGTALVWIPAMIVLAWRGDLLGIAVLAVLCGLVAGNLDNLLRPRLVGKDTQMHDLYILFGTLGGIGMFGVLGIIIGPIIAALFITIWEIYGKVFSDWLPTVRPEDEQARSENAIPDQPPDFAPASPEDIADLLKDMNRKT